MPWKVSLAPGQTIGPGLEYGFGTEGIPSGARGVGTQREWLQNSPFGPDTRGFLKGMGFDIDDVGEDPVYEVPNELTPSQKDFLVPFGKWKFRGGASHVRWTRLRYEQDVIAEQVRSTQLAQDRAKAAEDRLVMIQAQAKAAEIEAQIRAKEAQIAALNASGATTTGTTGGVPTTSTGGALRTLEVYGSRGGQVMPLMSVLQRTQTGGWAVVPGNSVMVGDAPTDGYGLAGVPGKWSQFYAGQSPASFGLDTDKAVMFWDDAQRRGFAVSAQYLQQLFGSNWRSVVF